MKKLIGYKFFTHDLRPPVQGGNPTWNGEIPFELPEVKMDESDKECGEGWNFCQDIKTGFKVVGMWPNGRPSRIFKVETTDKYLIKTEKVRANKLNILEEVSEKDINSAIHDFSKVFKTYVKDIAKEQIKWRHALSRPKYNLEKVKEGLQESLEIKGLNWKLKQYKTIWEAREAWGAREAWEAWEVWGAWEVREAWGAREAREVWGAWGAWEAWGALGALTVFFAAKNKWTNKEPSLLTRGLRDAYENGLELVIPTEKDTLGFVMSEKK